MLAAIKGISDFVFLTLLGVPLAAPLAVMVFIGGFIPYVGGFITTTILVLVTLSTQGISAVIFLLIGITIVNVVNGNILGPVIYGKTVSIHPALVLVSLPAGAAIAGIIGLFVAIPLVAIVLAVWGALLTILDPGPEYETPDLVPGWLDRLAQWSVRLLALIIVVGGRDPRSSRSSRPSPCRSSSAWCSRRPSGHSLRRSSDADGTAGRHRPSRPRAFSLPSSWS